MNKKLFGIFLIIIISLAFIPNSIGKNISNNPPTINIFSVDINDRTVTIDGEAIPADGKIITKIEVDWKDIRDWIHDGDFPFISTYHVYGEYDIKITAFQNDGLKTSEIINAPVFMDNCNIQSDYSGFYRFPESFFTGSSIPKSEVVKVTDAQYLTIKEMFNGICPYYFCTLEYMPTVYGVTRPYGVGLGDSAFPSGYSGHHHWEVMAHEQGHNFFGGTWSSFFYTVAVPGPLISESTAIISAFYSYHAILDKSGNYGISSSTINSLDYDYSIGKNIQKNGYNTYNNGGCQFDVNGIPTTQALAYKMIIYGETYGWNHYKKFSKTWREDMDDYFDFHDDGVTSSEKTTYMIASLSASFDIDFKSDFLTLNFPIDDDLYDEWFRILHHFLYSNDPPNTPSTPSGPDLVKAGESCEYNTSADDPIGDKVQYRFDWDADGNHDYSSWTNIDVSGHIGSITHIWTSSGVFTVKAQCRDEYGKSSDWSEGLIVSITNDPPNVPNIPNGKKNGMIDTSYTYSTSATDPDNNKVRCRFDWDDGKISEWTLLVNSGQISSKAHSWINPGYYNVKAQAKDEFGDVSDWSDGLSVSITSPSNDPPNIPLIHNGPTSGDIGISYSYSVSTSDPNEDMIKYGLDWNGDYVIDEWTNYYHSEEIANISHVWDLAGIYYVRVRAQDEHNANSDWSEPLLVFIQIENNPPEIPNIEGEINGKFGVEYNYTISSIDPDDDDVYFWILWYDGYLNGSWDGPYNSGDEIIKAYSWNDEGDYTIQVKSKDVYGDESDWATLEVNMPHSYNRLQILINRLILRFPSLEPLLSKYL